MTVSVPVGNSSDVVITNLNEDGNADLVVTSHSQGVVAMLGDGAGTFTAIPDLGVDPSEIVRAADLNGDGHVDLVAAGDQLSVLLGAGDGTFAPVVSYDSGSDVSNTILNLLGLAVTDLNGDGSPDLVTVNYVTSQLSVLFGTAEGTFGAPVVLPCRGCVEVAADDLDADADPDIVTVNPGISYTMVMGQPSVAVFLNDGTGNLGEPVEYDPLGHAVTLALTDLNGDEAPDVVTGNDSSNTISVLIGNGDGTLGASTTYPSGNTHTVAVSDLDSDGTVDVLSGSFEENTVTVYNGTGDGRLIATPGVDAMSETARSLGVADFNGDGKPDLALYVSSVGGRQVISILLQP